MKRQIIGRSRILDGCLFKNSVTFNVSLSKDIERKVVVTDVPSKITYAPNDEDIFTGETCVVITRPAIRSGSFNFDRLTIIGTDVIIVNELDEILIEGVLYEIGTGGVSYPYAFNQKTSTGNEYYVYPTGIANFFDVEMLHFGDIVRESLTIDRAMDTLYKSMFDQTYLADELSELYEPSELIVHKVSSLLRDTNLHFPEFINPYCPPRSRDHLTAMIHNVMEWRSGIEDVDLEVSISLADLMGADNGGSGRSTSALKKKGKKIEHNLNVLNIRHYQLLFELSAIRGYYNSDHDELGNGPEGHIVRDLVDLYDSYGKTVNKVVKSDSTIVVEYCEQFDNSTRDVVLVPLLLLTLPVFS